MRSKELNSRLLKLFLAFSFSAACTFGSPDTTDFVKIVESDSTLAREVGLDKLTKKQKKKLNEVMLVVYSLGFSNGQSRSSTVDTSTPIRIAPKYIFGSSVSDGDGYLSKVESSDGDVLKLANGAIVEVTWGYVSYIGYSKECLLYRIGSGWKIWIKGKKAYKCEVLKLPEWGSKVSVEQTTILEVKGDGTIIKLTDGRIYEVDSYSTIDTRLWLGFSDAIIIDASRLINLDEGDEIIDITLIK